MTLKELAKELSEKRHKNIPEHARPPLRFKDNGANELTKAILAFLELKGIQRWRQSAEGRYRPGKEYVNVIGQRKQMKGTWLPSAGNRGHGDITAILPGGRFCSIEVKFGKDSQKDDQKKFQEQIEKSGGIYMIVKTWDDFMFQISKYGV